jgi:hypothetical protein
LQGEGKVHGGREDGRVGARLTLRALETWVREASGVRRGSVGNTWPQSSAKNVELAVPPVNHDAVSAKWTRSS